MKRTALTSLTGMILAALVTSTAPRAAGQSKGFVPGQTPDGQPDLRGTWVNFDSTPFEAPPPAGQSNGAPIPSAPGVNPPSFWADHDSPMKAARRSMVVDPPNGRVPVMKWAEDKRAYDLDHVQDHEVHQTSWERCITRGMPAGMFPAGYNNAYEFIQMPGYVVIRYEMIHNARIIPIDGRPRLGDEDPAVGRRTARALGRHHARRRIDELQRQGDDRHERGDATHPRHPAERSAPRHRTLHAGRREHDRVPRDDRGQERLYRGRGPWRFR